MKNPRHYYDCALIPLQQATFTRTTARYGLVKDNILSNQYELHEQVFTYISEILSVLRETLADRKGVGTNLVAYVTAELCYQRY